MRHELSGQISVEKAVMVTGSAGFIGHPLVRQLAEQGRTVVSVYRHRLPDSVENVYPVCSDLSSPELIAAPLRGVETVVHLAWDGGLAGPGESLPADPLAPGAALTRNLRTVKNLITAMERAGTRRLVFLSALGASSRARSNYLREKYLAELLFLNSSIPEKVVLRSAVVWGGQGSADRFLTSIMRVMRYVVYPVPNRVARIAPLHVKDLVTLLVAAAETDTKIEASVMDVPGGESYAIGDLLKVVSQSLVRRPQFPLGGLLGESLLPLLERDAKEGASPRLHQFLCITAEGGGRDALRHDNPLAGILPEKIPGFRERLAN